MRGQHFKQRNSFRNKRSFSRGGSRQDGSGNKRFNKSWSQFELFRVIEESNKKQSVQVEEYNSTHSFNDFAISPILKNNILNKGYKDPTPIQDQAIPQILNRSDLIGIANTGTGKTAAFLIPLIEKVYNDRNERVLIVAPTRELAFQIYEEFRAFSTNMQIYAALCIGGTNLHSQQRELRKQPNFVIGTPGRLLDLAEQKYLNFSRFNNVVLDETDRMVDIGFIREIKFIISQLPIERQSLFFSATISPKVQEILQSFVKDPVTVSVKQREAAANVTQDVVKVDPRQNKIEVLHDLLIRQGFDKVMIFGRTKWGVQKVSEELVNRGFKAAAIHGDKSQSQRQRTLKQFKQNEITILLATDVASRGLDISDVSHVINYDMPECYEDYIHRIGRTGRANKLGTAITFI